MKKWATEEQNFPKGRSTNDQKTHEMLSMLDHKGNANQNHV
jgi:hypothetical protein